MAQVFHSGAFAQQCVAVHPLALSVKRIEAQERLVVSCRSCKMVHHFSFRSISRRESSAASQSTAGTGIDTLNSCLASHATAVSIREMDVFQEAVVLRCAECRRLYELSVSSFETHQR